MKPYRGEFPTHDRIPADGIAREEVLREMEAMRDREEAKWSDGYASGSVYHGDPEHIEFLSACTRSRRKRTRCTPTCGRAP